MDTLNSSIKTAYELHGCNDAGQWDALIDSSPQGHIFSKSDFLSSLGMPYSCHVVTDSQGQVLAGVAVLTDGLKMVQAPFAFTPHQGIVFSNLVCLLNAQKRLTVQFRITEFLINELLNIYSNFSMALSPFFKDMRPFLWHKYGKKKEEQFDIKLRYTGFINLQNFNLNEFLSTVRTVRRQEYKKSFARIQKTTDLKSFLSLYQQTFERQGLNISTDTISLVHRICEHALSKGYGHLSAAYIGDRIASMAFFVKDAKCAYYLFGASDPSMRDANASSKLLLDNIAEYAHQGMMRFDFVGVNSPQRGDFKLSFNAELMPYHEVHLSAHA